MIDHRKEKHHAEQQFKVFQRILQEHCERIYCTENNIIEVYNSNDEIIAEIDYFQKKVLCESQDVQIHLTELLELHHHSCVDADF